LKIRNNGLFGREMKSCGILKVVTLCEKSDRLLCLAMICSGYLSTDPSLILFFILESPMMIFATRRDFSAAKNDPSVFV
jgi:hypothetical protein